MTSLRRPPYRVRKPGIGGASRRQQGAVLYHGILGRAARNL